MAAFQGQPKIEAASPGYGGQRQRVPPRSDGGQLSLRTLGQVQDADNAVLIHRQEGGAPVGIEQ